MNNFCPINECERAAECGYAGECLKAKSEVAPSESTGPAKVVAAVPTGSTHSVIEIQNALRLLTRVMKRDDELIFTGGDIIVFRDHLYRTQEISTMLGSNDKAQL